MICDECETVAHCMKNGCVPKTIKKDEAMKLALKAMEDHGHAWARHEVQYSNAMIALREALAEQPAQQEPVSEGWKLVPVEPTEDMWKAVNKLDDEMAAGSYDGKGCSIEQAWDCLLDTAPAPPAQQEPVAFVKGRGWRDGKLEVIPAKMNQTFEIDQPLYTSPPAQRTWVGLSPEEKKNIFLKWYGKHWAYTKQVQAVMDSVEAKLKEKNNG